ncbi:MAG: di-trans,poly-cis-decaprenylcistransferase [Halomonadaceae bacterium]|nr:MAG: di-trans,poly-cis-decaprenylcistransferase [Halomonadaceae bacterium]
MTETASAATLVESGGCPRHVAVIMDGNNRWAKHRQLSGIAGHRAGVGAVRAAVETCGRAGVEVLTLFAFSSENWRRPKEEVGALMRLFLWALKREVRKLDKNNIRLRVIGDRNHFSQQLQEHIRQAEALTAANTGMTLVVAADYGGQWDITQATQRIAQGVAAGQLMPSDITEDLFQSYLSLGDLPMPDLLVRTGGEQRISNFLLWQFAYTEFYFSPVFWPDFMHEEMRAALKAYAHRKRRFGRTDEQLDGDVLTPAQE